MEKFDLDEGDLLAYLDGETLPHVARALGESSALQQAANELQEFESLLRSKLGGQGRLDPQDLVDVAAGQATDQQRLLVAAYVRQSAEGRRVWAALQAEGGAQPKPRTRRPATPLWLATPLTLLAGLRSAGEEEVQQTFQITAIQAQVTVRIPPPVGEQWQISGLVMQNQQPVLRAKASLRNLQTTARRRTVVAEGFFAFRHLPAGSYELRIQLEQATILLADKIELRLPL